MIKTAIGKWESLREVFGRGYSWSYRMFRLREFFSHFEYYYEVTVIPAIVLGCATALIHPIFNSISIGVSSIPTISEAVCAFLFFLVCMSVENVWDACRR